MLVARKEFLVQAVCKELHAQTARKELLEGSPVVPVVLDVPRDDLALVELQVESLVPVSVVPRLGTRHAVASGEGE